MQEDFVNTVPLVISLDVAGALLGASRPTAYALAKRGVIPVLPGPGRKRVPVARLEALLGRPLAVLDLANARKRLAPERQKYLEYQRAYREAKDELKQKEVA